MLVRILKAWYKLFLVVHIALPPSAGGLSPGIFTRNPFLPSKQSLSLWKRKNELVELVFGKTELAGELLGKRRLGRAGSELGLDALV